MKIKRGECNIVLPPIGEFIGARWETADRMLFALHRVTVETMLAIRKDAPEGVRGRPVYICVTDEKAVLFPATDEDGELKIRYFPPMVEA